MKPPNYREGTTAEHCGNCGAIVHAEERSSGKPFCRMYQTNVEESRVCDSWYPQGQRNRRLKIVR